MAAGRDVARHQKLVREEQRRRNREAVMEAEERRTEQEMLSGMTPGEIRRHQEEQRRARRLGQSMERPESYEDKMDRGERSEDKTEPVPVPEPEPVPVPEPMPEPEPEEPEADEEPKEPVPKARDAPEVAYASPQAQALAERIGLTAGILGDWEPSSTKGFTKSDIEEIAATEREG